MEELIHYVFYDIEIDRIRNRVAEICKDYGLERIQFSGFSGRLRKSKREELFLKITHAIQEGAGKILILPLCEKDVKETQEFVHEREEDAGTDTAESK